MPSTPETPPSDLSEFLAARLDDDVAEGSCEGAEEYASCRDLSARRELEIEAKRRILKEHPLYPRLDVIAVKPDGLHGFGCNTCHQDEGRIVGYGWCATLRALALPYAGHPDYKEGWRL